MSELEFLDPHLKELIIDSIAGNNRDDHFETLKKLCTNNEQDQKVIDAIIEMRRDIIDHPCPQNRTESYPYCEQEIGFVFYKLHQYEISVEIEDKN